MKKYNEDRISLFLFIGITLLIPFRCIQQNMGHTRVEKVIEGTIVLKTEASCNNGGMTVNAAYISSTTPCLKYDIKGEDGQFYSLVFSTQADPFSSKFVGNTIKANVVYVKKLTGELTITKVELKD